MPIIAISRVALDGLRRAHGPVAVHSRFVSGVNVRLGDVLAFAGPGAAAGACGIDVSAADVGVLSSADDWVWDGTGLVHDGLPSVVLARDARVYDPAAPALDAVTAADATAVDRIRRDAGGHSWFDDGEGPSRVGVSRLRAALAGLAAGVPDAAAIRVVVGMGIGLTPSGDDALAGGLCVLYGLHVRRLDTVASVLVDADGGPRTTDVSMSYLRLASRGLFSPSLAGVVASLHGPVSRLRDAVATQLRFGATSGADALVGVREACVAVSGARPRPPTTARPPS